MIIYQSKSHNPYFNIAAEEYFLKNFTDDVFYLYVNEPSIIVGKHQNTIAEINVPYVIQNELKVVRRLSGGGTVFHDLGNLNYCFIQNGTEGHLVDFKKYSQPVLDTLNDLNVNAYLRGKSDLVIDDLKFSGNAEHVFKNRILHHGTLLFSSELNSLNKAIQADWTKFNDKAVRSNRSKVTNIIDHLEKPLTIYEFEQKVIETVILQNKQVESYALTKSDEEAINTLVDEKYSTWKWNFAYSPKYEFKKEIPISHGVLSSKISVNKGFIESLSVLINSNSFDFSGELEKRVLNKPHDFYVLKNEISGFFDENHAIPFTFDEFLKTMF
ncbi:MAG: lipoate--protein ligase [Salinivirgaceae bacterium]|nr:lipoate--protein ligase [Salinivirgaceae bacterium]